MIAEIDLEPIGNGDHLADDVARVVECVAGSGLSYQVTAMGTLVEGEPDRVWDLLRQCHRTAREKNRRVVMTVRIDDREGARDQMDRAVRRVEELTGKPALHRPTKE